MPVIAVESCSEEKRNVVGCWLSVGSVLLDLTGVVEERPVDVVFSGGVPVVVVLSSVVLASDGEMNSVGVVALLWIKGVGSVLISPE